MSWRRIKRVWSELRRGRPGRRFQDYYQARRRGRSRAATGWRVGLGVLLIVAGLLLSIPPLVPGFLVTAAGLAMLASQSCRVARALDRIECWFWRARHSADGQGPMMCDQRNSASPQKQRAK